MSDFPVPIEAIIDHVVGRDGQIERKSRKRAEFDPSLTWSYDNPVRRLEGWSPLVAGESFLHPCPCSGAGQVCGWHELPRIRFVEMRPYAYANTVRGEVLHRLDVWVGQCPECRTIWWEAKG